MEDYKKLRSAYARIKKRYESMNFSDTRVDKLLNENNDTLFFLKSLSISNQEEILEAATKIKILIAGSKLILNEKQK